MKKLTFLLLAALLSGLMSCEKDEKAALVIPETYDGANFTANTTVQSGIRTRFEELVREMQKGRTPGTVVDANLLNRIYTTVNPTLQSITTPYYNGQLVGLVGWLAELGRASGNTYTPAAPSGGQGGTFGGYLFDENGLELEQLVDKGLFGAAHYNHALSLAQGPLTLATVDQMISIFGASPSFPATNTASKTSTPDKFMALYGARRDKNDGNGLYTQIKKAFIKLQAAIKAGNDYAEEQQEALREVFSTWEKINAATVINYCHQTIAGLSATNPTNQQKGAALHAYGEGVGFTHGFRTVNSPYRTITDAQIDEILTLLNAPATGTPTSYRFVTDPVNELPKLTQVINRLKAIYQFSDQQIEDFKKNWITEQGR